MAEEKLDIEKFEWVWSSILDYANSRCSLLQRFIQFKGVLGVYCNEKKKICRLKISGDMVFWFWKMQLEDFLYQKDSLQMISEEKP